MADESNGKHLDELKWTMIFYYICGSTVMVFAYLAVITFIKIPADNIRFVDTSLGFLLGTFLSGGAGYLIGGTAATMNKKAEPPAPTVPTETSATAQETEVQISNPEH